MTMSGHCNADNVAKLSPSEVAALRAATPSASLPWLYPAEGTVFPRGLRAPLLMWQSASPARAVYVRIKSAGASTVSAVW